MPLVFAAFCVGVVVGVGVMVLAAVVQSSMRFKAVLRWVTCLAVEDWQSYLQLPPVETIWKSTAPLKVDAWLPPDRVVGDVAIPLADEPGAAL